MLRYILSDDELCSVDIGMNGVKTLLRQNTTTEAVFLYTKLEKMLNILTTETSNRYILAVSAVVLFPAAVSATIKVSFQYFTTDVIDPDLAHSFSILIIQRHTGISVQNRIHVSCIGVLCYP